MLEVNPLNPLNPVMSSKFGELAVICNARALARRSRVMFFCFFEGPLVYNAYFFDHIRPGGTAAERQIGRC